MASSVIMFTAVSLEHGAWPPTARTKGEVFLSKAFVIIEKFGIVADPRSDEALLRCLDMAPGTKDRSETSNQ